jgi:DNA-binding beta-propeller fold protein YncE
VARPGAGERFCREVHAAARLQHANVVTAFDAERAGDCLFLAMEYVEGESLAERVARDGPLAVPEACRAVRDAALGLQHALEHGLIHRDIKPQNLMAAADGTVKVLDFGLASLAEAGAASLTGSNIVMGTPDYIAPEQAEDPHGADARSDIYSLGCTLYFLLSGCVPFPGNSALQKLYAHRNRTPQPVRVYRPDIPAELAAALDRMMAKEPARRLQTPAEVAAALEPFARALRPASRTSRAAKSRWPLVAVATGLLLTGLALAAGIVVSFRTGNGTIEVETDDPRVKVVVERNGERVAILDPQSKQRWVLDTGDYTVQLDGNPAGLKIELPQTFHLKRGDRHVVTIRRGKRAGAEDAKTAVKEPVGEVRQVQWYGRHVYSTGFSPDGRYYYVTGQVEPQNTTRIWETATGKLVREITGNEWAAFTPDGKRLLCPGPDKALHLWDMATGKEIRSFEGHTDWVATVAISPDGKRALSGSNDTTVRVWDLETGMELKRLEAHTHSSRAFFAPDGKYFLTYSHTTDRTLRLYDAATYKEVRSWEAPGDNWYAAFAPDGQGFLTITYGDWTVHWWDLKRDKVVKSLKLEGDPLNGMGFSPDCRRVIYAASRDNTVRVVDLHSGKEVARFDVPTAPYGLMAISPDGRFAVGATGNGWVYVWRLPAPPQPPH